jgi:hypothetical protein
LAAVAKTASKGPAASRATAEIATAEIATAEIATAEIATEIATIRNSIWQYHL